MHEAATGPVRSQVGHSGRVRGLRRICLFAGRLVAYAGQYASASKPEPWAPARVVQADLAVYMPETSLSSCHLLCVFELVQA